MHYEYLTYLIEIKQNCTIHVQAKKENEMERGRVCDIHTSNSKEDTSSEEGIKNTKE